MMMDWLVLLVWLLSAFVRCIGWAKVGSIMRVGEALLLSSVGGSVLVCSPVMAFVGRCVNNSSHKE